MHKKYISIIALLSFISFGNEAFSQKGKRGQTKRGAANRLAAKRNTQKTTPKNTQEQISAPVTPETVTVEETNPIDTQNIQAEIERLTNENTLLRNSINEKQTKIDDINSELDDLNESLANLEYKQNKSKNVCSQISLKKMDDIKGWLIATVASSGLGTIANATATVTTFMQKDPSKLKKSDKKEEEKKPEDDINNTEENNDETINEETNDVFEVQPETQKLDLEEIAKPEPIEQNLTKQDLEIKPLNAQTKTVETNLTIGNTEKTIIPQSQSATVNQTIGNTEKTIIPQPKSADTNQTIGRNMNEAIEFEKKLLKEQDNTVDPLKHLNTDTKANTTAKATTTKLTSSAKTMTQDTSKSIGDPCYDANGNYKYGIRYENGMEISCLGGPQSEAERKQINLMLNLLEDDLQTTPQKTSSAKKEKKTSKKQSKEQKKTKQSNEISPTDKKAICDGIRANKDNDLNWKYNLMINGCNDSSYNTLTQPMQKESKWTSYRKLFVFAAENIEDKIEDKQEKKNQTLSNISTVSSIVGTVASGASVITSGVVTSLIATMEKQVKSCKETF